MKKSIVITLLLLLGLSMLSASAVGLFTNSKGKVTLTRNNRSIKFKNGDMIYNQDEIRTGKDSFASYKYVDGASTVKIFANSYVLVSATQSGKSQNKKAQVNSGSVHTKVTPGRGGNMAVETPTTVASVKGTEFMTLVGKASSTFIVKEGVVNLLIKATNQSADVKAGETAHVDEDLNLEIRTSTDEELGLIEHQESSAAQDYVPRTITVQVADDQGRIKYIEITY